MTWPETGKAARRSVALLPLGSIEQHGPHLAVSTDSAIVTSLAEAVERRLPDRVVLCPTLPYGSSDHHLDFPGTMSLGGPAYARVIEDLVRSLVRAGFRKVVLLNGHGGNTAPASVALAALSSAFDEEPAPTLALVTYWEACGRLFEGAGPMVTPALSHACEYETSLVLHVFPRGARKGLFSNAARSRRNPRITWEGSGPIRGVHLFAKTARISASGNTGRPDLASEAKGRHLFGGATAALAAFVRDFAGWAPMRDLRPGGARNRPVENRTGR
jgi:creatinine amidohydrolase